MKRSELKPDPAKVRDWMARSRAKAAANARGKPRKPLAPGKRKAKVHVPAPLRAQVMARQGGVCVAPWCNRKATQVHHVLEERNFPAWALALDNLVGVCVGCHDEHERAHRRLPWACLPPSVRAFVQHAGQADGRAARTAQVNYPRREGQT